MEYSIFSRSYGYDAMFSRIVAAALVTDKPRVILMPVNQFIEFWTIFFSYFQL